ncbi:MAG TPA: hypothetical protein VHW01_00170 [Polyangiaceae bacterium]|nr:hypothetical protein [Polyangiaceae bacterium]
MSTTPSAGQRVLLVCAATRTEHDACVAGIRAAGVSRLETLLVGVGPEHAARRLYERLASGGAPTRILSTGFAGVLDGSLPLGTWVYAQTLSEWKQGALVPIAGRAPAPPQLDGFPCLPCDVVSTDQLVGRHSALRHLGSQRPLVADMESAALAREANARGIPFSVLRLVSDTRQHPLPEFLAPLTAALASSHAGTRLSLAARGIGSALADPRGVARLLSTGQSLTKQLRHDFARLARLLEAEA